MTLRLMYPSEFGKTQNELVQMIIGIAQKDGRKCQEKRWDYCSGFGNKGWFLSGSKHLNIEHKPFFLFHVVLSFWNFFQWNWMHFIPMLLWVAVVFLGSIFKKTFIKYLVCLFTIYFLLCKLLYTFKAIYFLLFKFTT